MFKERMTDDAVYFLGGPYSQWFPAFFRAPLAKGGDLYEFSCSEQYQMARKALALGDEDILTAILCKAAPGGNRVFFEAWEGAADSERVRLNREFRPVASRYKELGREAKPWVAEKWESIDVQAVFVGNFYKFSQNRDLCRKLVDAGERVFVEGSRQDRIWGVGIDYADPRIENRDNWLGQNKLGRVIGAVSDAIVFPPVPFPLYDPFDWQPGPNF